MKSTAEGRGELRGWSPEGRIEGRTPASPGSPAGEARWVGPLGWDRPQGWACEGWEARRRPAGAQVSRPKSLGGAPMGRRALGTGREPRWSWKEVERRPDTGTSRPRPAVGRPCTPHPPLPSVFQTGSRQPRPARALSRVLKSAARCGPDFPLPWGRLTHSCPLLPGTLCSRSRRTRSRTAGGKNDKSGRRAQLLLGPCPLTPAVEGCVGPGLRQTNP